MRGLLFWLVLLLLGWNGLRTAYRTGSRLPWEHRASATGMVAAPPDRVWELLAEALPESEWRTGVRRVQTQDPQWTPGVCWVEYWMLMRFPLCVAEQQPGVRRVVKTQDWGPMPFAATWTYELVPAGGGTRVTITEESSIRKPLWRLYGRYWLRGRTGAAQMLRDIQAEAPRTK